MSVWKFWSIWQQILQQVSPKEQNSNSISKWVPPYYHQKLELDQLPHVQEHAPISTKQTQCITTKNYQMHNVVCQSTSYSKLSLEFEHVYYLCNSTTSLIISSLHINDHNPKLYMYPIREQQTWKSVYSLIVPSIQPWGDTWTSCSPLDITQNKLLDSHLYTYRESKNRVENSKWTITYIYMCLTSMMLPCKLN